jgi:hypothetical protein
VGETNAKTSKFGNCINNKTWVSPTVCCADPTTRLVGQPMRYVILVSTTFVIALILGAISAIMAPLSPWDAPLNYITSWLIRFDLVSVRYSGSVNFCGDCGDLYLLTVEFFLLLTIFYLVVLAHAILRGGYHEEKTIAVNDPPQKTMKAFVMLALASCIMIGIIWSLLFSNMFMPSSISRSNSDYSMFGFTLIFLVSVAFHAIILCVMAFAVIMEHSMKH